MAYGFSWRLHPSSERMTMKRGIDWEMEDGVKICFCLYLFYPFLCYLICLHSQSSSHHLSFFFFVALIIHSCCSAEASCFHFLLLLLLLLASALITAIKTNTCLMPRLPTPTSSSSSSCSECALNWGRAGRGGANQLRIGSLYVREQRGCTLRHKDTWLQLICILSFSPYHSSSLSPLPD